MKKSKEENPFFIINSMGEDPENGILSGEIDETLINEYLTNISYSLHKECIHFSDRANGFRNIPKRYFYHFYHEVLPKRKRWSKWPKKDKSKDELISAIMELSHLNKEQAYNSLKLLDNKSRREIMELVDKGGIETKNGKRTRSKVKI